MDASMFEDVGKAIVTLFVIGIILAIGLWELIQWLWSFIDISILITK